MDYKDEDTKIFDLIDQNESEDKPKGQNSDNQKKNQKIKKKFNFKEKWTKFTKKQKILIISSISLLIILIIIGIVFIIKKNSQKDSDPKLIENEIVIENKNYRYASGKLILLDKNGKDIGEYTCHNKDNKKCYVAYNSTEDDLDETKYIYQNGNQVKTQTPIINNSYAFIYDNSTEENGLIILYDIKQGKEIETYRLVKKAINNDSYFIVANTSGEYGLINITDQGVAQIIKFKYEYLGIVDKSVQQLDYIIAKINGKYELIDKDEKQISKPIKEAIVGFNENYLKVKNSDGEYSLYDYKGNKLFKNNYEYIYLVNNCLGVVKNDLLYIMDSTEKFLNIEGIKLPNKYYNKTYIYDEKDKLLEIQNAVDITISDNNIAITTKENDKDKVYNINVLEQTINNKLSYVSYLDGKLYFYSDEEKQNIIGYYPCKNKNIITDENSQLKNCYLAQESSYKDNELNNRGYLPIINSRYVFVNDVLDANTKSIVLYDLVDKKAKSTYLSVDAGIYTNNNQLSFYDTNNLNVISISAKKNKYGIISISKSDVTSMLDFSSNKIERLQDYFLVNRSSGTYYLMDENKNAITKEYSYKIVDLFKNYVKVIDNDNKYRVFDFNGNEITNGSYDYIALHPNYIAAIKSNKLTVYNYDKIVFVKDIELKIADYENAYSIDEGQETVIIYNPDNTYEKIFMTAETQ